MIGSNAVTETGTASVIHHTAIKTIQAAVYHAETERPSGAPKKTINSETAGPSSRPICLPLVVG